MTCIYRKEYLSDQQQQITTKAPNHFNSQGNSGHWSDPKIKIHSELDTKRKYLKLSKEIEMCFDSAQFEIGIGIFILAVGIVGVKVALEDAKENENDINQRRFKDIISGGMECLVEDEVSNDHDRRLDELLKI